MSSLLWIAVFGFFFSTGSGDANAGDPSCWDSTYTFKRCCLPPPVGNDGCFTHEQDWPFFSAARCCRVKLENESARVGWTKSPMCDLVGFDPPVLCAQSALAGWSHDEMRASLPEFAQLYKQRPIKQNEWGMNVNHVFALWFLVRKLRPRYIIESGVFKGQGTWLLRQAAGSDTFIFSLDPRNVADLLYREPSGSRTRYLMGAHFQDFNNINWSTHFPPESFGETLVVFDDHQSHLKRVHNLLSHGFVHSWFEDNEKWGADAYTFNVMCSLLPSGAKKVIYLDDWGNIRETISIEEHSSNLHYVLAHVEAYFEFAPIFDGCGRTPSLQLVDVLELEELGLPLIEEEFNNYYHMPMPYVKLKPWPPRRLLAISNGSSTR